MKINSHTKVMLVSDESLFGWGKWFYLGGICGGQKRLMKEVACEWRIGVVSTHVTLQASRMFS